MRRVVRNALWWIQDYAFAARWQLRAVLGARRPERYRSGPARPVVVIPGIWETWAFMRPLVEQLHRAGHPVHVLAALRRNGRPVASAAADVAEYIRDAELRDVLLLAHSKGGLIGKYVMALLDDTGRVDRMVAIATPFAGSRYAQLMLLPSLRAFSPRNATTLMLAENLEVNRRIVSVFGEFDPHIPEGSEILDGRNVRLPTGGHFRILADPATVETVLEAAAG